MKVNYTNKTQLAMALLSENVRIIVIKQQMTALYNRILSNLFLFFLHKHQICGAFPITNSAYA